MPKYVVLGNFTQDGIQKIKDSPKRIEAARKQLKDLGGKIKDFYYTMGRYDFVLICKAPDDEAMTKWLLTVGGVGAVRTETLPATPSDKAAEWFKELP